MLKTIVLAAGLTVFLAAPAFAGHCPADAKAIDHALSVMNVSASVKAEVTALRDEGMALHASGDHADAEDSMSKAMRILLSAAA